MTKPMMDLRALVETRGDADLLREMIGFAVVEPQAGHEVGHVGVGKTWGCLCMLVVH